MRSRADILEQFIGRRGVSCLGFFFLLFAIAAAAALLYSIYGPQKDLPPKEGSAAGQSSRQK